MRPNKIILTRKLLIWVMVFLLQILFIGSYWLMPSSIEDNTTLDVIIASPKFQEMPGGDPRQGNIDFITKSSVYNWKAGNRRNSKKLIYSKQKVKLKNVNRFERDFVFKTMTMTVNQTEEETSLGIWNDTEKLWCFTKGLEDERVKGPEEDLYSPKCKCKAGWHGRDCGQPEVIWRALMTAKHQPFQIKIMQQKKREDAFAEPNKLVAFIEGNFLNLDMLELQLASIVTVVDYFMLFLKINTEIQKNYDYKSLHKRLDEILKDNQRYELFSCDYSKEDTRRNSQCSTQKAFQAMQQRLENVKPTDLILYLQERIIISTPALIFLKYYADSVEMIRFRLKYNVYGYFWQHEKQTHLNGLLSSFLHLDNQQGDFGKLYNKAYASNSWALIIGDLNHFGGWFCEFCLQPNEIILELHISNASSFNQQQQQQQQQPGEQQKLHIYDENQVRFPNMTKPQNIIDTDYIQKLISNGIHLDGKTSLLKIRNHQDQYYAPAYAQEHTWKYGSFLVNLYESLDGDDDDENEIIGGYN